MEDRYFEEIIYLCRYCRNTVTRIRPGEAPPTICPLHDSPITRSETVFDFLVRKGVIAEGFFHS